MAVERGPVQAVTDIGVTVSTGKSPKGTLVPAWMIVFAWQLLKARGRLENDELLNQLYPRVMRSSFVCALLARLPGGGRGRSGRSRCTTGGEQADSSAVL